MKKVIVTEDGKSFDNEEDAQAHEELVQAKWEYESARRRYAARELWESQKTADGYRFKLTLLIDYYYVYWLDGRIPTIRSVNFYLYNLELDEHDRAVILDMKNVGKYGPAKYRISDLYKYRYNAEAQLLVRLEEHLEEVQEKIDAVKSNLEED
jgi:hypothetical protein